MSGSYLLDTNIVIALFANEAQVVAQLQSAAEVFVPAVVLGELYYGACKSAHSKTNLALIDSFANKSAILACDATTARHYGRIKDHLRSKGQPIPENDVWIAALAKQHELALVSRDRHFAQIREIRTVTW